MTSIAVIADSDASIPSKLAKQYMIEQVPIHIHFGTETYKTNSEIDDARVFERVDRENKLPTTSAPSPGEFQAAFDRAFDQGADAVLCYCVSSEISAVYNNAVMAREMLPEKDITVVDSRVLSMAQGYMALEAARAVRSGSTIEEAVQQSLEIRDRTYIFGALSTLRYLAMSGRVGHVAAGMANLLDVRPILTLQNGKLDLLEKVRTRKKAWKRTIQLIEEVCGGKPIEQLTILHVNVPEEAAAFHQLLCETMDCPEEVPFAELTPGLSVHTGAGLVGATVVVSGE